MKATDYLRFIVREIHTTVVATVDEQGLPVTCAIDIMDSDENSLYFLTAKGKSFYERLNAQISALAVQRKFVRGISSPINVSAVNYDSKERMI
jgi:uncharacterized pyridoxamine 5'-phosphate oxidase family protein